MDFQNRKPHNIFEGALIGFDISRVYYICFPLFSGYLIVPVVFLYFHDFFDGYQWIFLDMQVEPPWISWDFFGKAKNSLEFFENHGIALHLIEPH